MKNLLLSSAGLQLAVIWACFFLILESDAEAELFHFPGQNTIQPQSNSDRLTAFRSGTTVTFEGSDETELKILSTVFNQTIEFNDGVSKNKYKR